MSTVCDGVVCENGASVGFVCDRASAGASIILAGDASTVDTEIAQFK